MIGVDSAMELWNYTKVWFIALPRKGVAQRADDTTQ
jgi:hypothetical protein